MIPYFFLPTNIYQTRAAYHPICRSYDHELDQYLIGGLTADCDAIPDLLDYGIRVNPVTNKTEMCPELRDVKLKYNFTSKSHPFVVEKYTDDDNNELDVYHIKNLYAFPISEQYPMGNIKDQLEALKACAWTDLQTRKVIINIPFVVTIRPIIYAQFTLKVSFSQTGRATTSKTLSYARHVDNNDELSKKILDTSHYTEDERTIMSLCIWSQVLCYIYLTLDVIYNHYELVIDYCIKKSSDKNGNNRAKNFIIALLENKDGALISLVLISFLILQGICTNLQNDKVAILRSMVEDVGRGTDRINDAYMDKFVDGVSVAAEAAWVTKYVDMIAVIFWLIKMLYIFQSINAVSVIPRTLTKSAANLGYLIVTSLVFMYSFSLLAHLSFGHVVERWTHPTEMAMQVFKMMLGDYADQEQEFYEWSGDNFVAPVLFIFFSIFLMLTIVNIFLSIILDAYAEVTEEVERNKGKEKPNNNTTSTDTDTTNNNGIAGITEKETDNDYDGLKKKVDAAWDE